MRRVLLSDGRRASSMCQPARRLRPSLVSCHRPRDPYDLRPPHQLVPNTKIVTVTDAVDRSESEAVKVTIVAVVRPFGDLPVSGDVERPLKFSSLRLVSYE